MEQISQQATHILRVYVSVHQYVVCDVTIASYIYNYDLTHCCLFICSSIFHDCQLVMRTLAIIATTITFTIESTSRRLVLYCFPA